MLFYEGGCVNCGGPRLSEEDKKNGVKIVDRNCYIANDLGGEVVLGLCGDCMKIEDKYFDLAKIKENMLISEQTAHELRLAFLKKMDFRCIRKRKTVSGQA